MIKRLALLFTSLIFLTACGTTSNEVNESKYDEVELIHYQTCINAATGGMKNFLNAQFYMDNAILACEKYKPTKS